MAIGETFYLPNIGYNSIIYYTFAGYSGASGISVRDGSNIVHIKEGWFILQIDGKGPYIKNTGEHAFTLQYKFINIQ